MRYKEIEVNDKRFKAKLEQEDGMWFASVSSMEHQIFINDIRGRNPERAISWLKVEIASELSYND